MKEGKGFPDIIEEIINSYEIKVRAVNSLIGQVIQRNKSFYREQARMADRLKDILSKNQSLEGKDFDTMMAGIQIQQAKREREITQMIEDFCREEKETVLILREMLSGTSSYTLEDFPLKNKKMLESPEKRRRKFSWMFKYFYRDQKELTAGLRKLLEKGSELRIKDFKAMIKAFSMKHQDEVSGVYEVLEEFERVKDDIGNQWQKVIASISKLGITALPVRELY